MAVPRIDIFGNVASRVLCDSNGTQVTLPAFYPDLYSFRMKLLDRNVDGQLIQIHPTVVDLSVSIGPVYLPPRAGKFKLRFGPLGTATAKIDYNEAADSFKTKLAVLTESTTYGLDEVYVAAPGTWMVRFSNAVVNALQAADNLLEPETFIRVTEVLQNGRIWYEVRLIQGPLASTSAFDHVLADAPSMRRIREGVTYDDGLVIIKTNEVQALTVPADFLGTYALKYSGQQTILLSANSGPDTIQAALNSLYQDKATRFLVTNPELNNAYIEFTGPLSGQAQPLLELVIGSTGERELTFDLNLKTAEVAAALRETESVTAIMECKLRTTDPNIIADAGNDLILFQSEVTILRPLQWDGLEGAAPIDWLRPPNPIDYVPFDVGQVITGQQSYSTSFGDGVLSTFDIAHMLAADGLIVQVRENVSNGKAFKLVYDTPGTHEFAIVFNNNNHLTVVIGGSVPAANSLLITITASGPKSAFQNHTHAIGQVVGLQGQLDQLNAQVAQLQALLPTQLPASPNALINPFGAADTTTILTIDINEKQEILPLTRPPQNIDLKTVVVTNKAMPRAGILLPAIHIKPDCVNVTGAGTTTVNGVYLPDGSVLNGKPVYQLSGGTVNDDSISWSGSAWIIKHGATSQYQSTDAVTKPWLATTWTTTGGTGPVPTVAATFPPYPAVVPVASANAGKIFLVDANSAATAPGGSGIRGEAVVPGDYVGCDGRIFYKAKKSDRPIATNFPGANVSGAGNALVNGVYLPDGTLLNTKPKYQLDGGTPDSDSITWSGTAWVIKRGGVSQYQSTDNVAKPWLATTWTVTGGSAPVPTVTETLTPNSFYPAAFDRELFRVAINEQMFKVDATMTLRFDVWTQMFRQTSNAQYLLVVEFAATPAQATPSPVGPNLQDVIWSIMPVLQQRLILTDTGVTHSFGVQVVRKSDGTLKTNKKIYGTVLAGDDVPAAATFAVRARLIEFDTENSIPGAQGLVYYRLETQAKIDITAGAVVAL